MTRTALVLGGGGITGVAWEIGILRGLADAGLDLTTADVVVGTSAGSVVGVQVTSGAPLAEVYDAQLEPPDHEIGAAFGRATMIRMLLPLVVPGSPRRKRRRIGRSALRAHPPGGAERREVIRSRLTTSEWPDRDLRITAVEAETGVLRVLTRDSGVDVVSAVAASCAVPLVWPAVTIDDRHYVDGGMRSPTNADLAQGCDVVVVVAPIPRTLSRAVSAGAELRRLAPQRSAVVSPDPRALQAFGNNLLDPQRRTAAAEAGLRQAADVLDEVRAVWPATGRVRMPRRGAD